MPDGGLSRSSAIPLYFQLQELLKEKIEAGTWRTGQMIPSEPDLCELYDVSRTVVRQALSVLEQDGQLRRVRGRGTFVSAPKITQRVGGLSRLLASPVAGQRVEVLDHRHEVAPARVCDQLELAGDPGILRVMSLVRVGEAPVALFDSFFPLRVAASIDDLLHAADAASSTSPSRPRTVVELTRTTVAIETSFCSAWEAEQLRIPLKGAVFVTLCTEFESHDDRPRPLEVARGVYRVDRVRLHFDVPSEGEVPAALWQVADA
jgi:GntR family transcriptional regulator